MTCEVGSPGVGATTTRASTTTQRARAHSLFICLLGTLLSSSTVFMFSIHSASTGPSNVTQFLLSVSSLTLSRTSVGTRPSVHSCVAWLTSPYSSPIVMLFGFSLCILTHSYFGLSSPSRLSCVRPFWSPCRHIVLPVRVSPTTITPWRTSIVSKSWMILATYVGTGCSPASVSCRSMAVCSMPYSTDGMTTPGKRSEISPWKSGTSSYRNLGRLESRSARISVTSSPMSGFSRLSEPAITSTDLTARMPKS